MREVWMIPTSIMTDGFARMNEVPHLSQGLNTSKKAPAEADALSLPLGRNEPRAETVVKAQANNKETRCFAKSLSVVP